MENITEVVSLLKKYVKLEEEINILTRTKGMSQDVLKESQTYRSFLNTQYELNRKVLNGGEIIEIYRNVKNLAEQKINEKENKEINELVENLEEIIKGKKGTIIDEIKERINEYK